MKGLFLSLFLLCFLSDKLFAQDCNINPNQYGCPGWEDPDDEVPLDSGVGLLIGAATLYTVKKIRERKESNNDTSELG